MKSQHQPGNRIYLDFAAATPMDERVYAAMRPYFTEKFHNPSALYEGAREAKADLEAARSSVATSIGSRSSEIVFTAGGTESANLAVHGIMQHYPDSELIVSAIEHEAVLHPASMYSTKYAQVDKNGIVDVYSLADQITDKTVLLSIMLVNNEVGSIQPIQEISDLIHNIRKERQKNGNQRPLYIHTDACQAPLYIDCNVARSGVDLMTLNGGKMHGPKQSGILYVRSGVILTPIITGGGQEWGYRSGTENVAFAVGFARALELASRGRNVRMKETTRLRDWFMSELESRFDAHITGHRKHRAANNIHAIFEGVDNERVLFALDQMGIDAAAGSACSASKETSSHVLLAMGYTDNAARSSLRMTIAHSTTQEQLEHVIDKLKQALIA